MKILKMFFCFSVCFSTIFCFNGCVDTKVELLKQSEYVETATTENYIIDIFKDYAEIVEYIGKSDEVEVISEYEDMPVKSIGEYAFKDLESLKSVVIPSSVLKIGQSSFSGCKNLETLEIKNGVTEICRNAFEDNTSLKSVVIPSSVIYLGSQCFYGCENLEKVSISSNLKNIGGGAFAYTKWLDSFKDDFVFAGDNVLISYKGEETEVKLPEKTKQVSAFFENYFLKKVVLNESLESIGERCFSDCGVLNEIEFCDNVKMIGKNAFLWCQSLKRITLPESLETIDDEAFSDCAILEEIIVPKSVKTVGMQIFQRCENLKDITFENGNIKLEYKLFSNENKFAVLHAAAGSSVEKFCREKGYNFQAIK